MALHDLTASGLLAQRADDRESAYSAVASILWREREILERVLYKLTCQQLILHAGQVRWLSSIDDEVRDALALLKDCEVLRAVEVNELAQRLGVATETSLRELAALAPEPWATLFTDHRESLLQLTAEISATTAENRRVLLAGAAASAESLARSHSANGTYGAQGQTVAGTFDPIMLDHRA